MADSIKPKKFYVTLGGRKFEGLSEPGKATFFDPRKGEGTGKSEDGSFIIEAAKKTGYVQGVCESAAAVGNPALAKKLLAELQVTKDLAERYAKPETYDALEKEIFAPERALGLKR